MDPGGFARKLMQEAQKSADSTSDGPPDSFTILSTALENSLHIVGSSTALILSLHEDTLLSSNIGDSGFLLLRDGELLASTPPQQHRFNFPYQLGTKGDSVFSAQNFVVKLQAGDVIVAGTDGLFDNVFSHQITSLLRDAKEEGDLPGVVARKLAKLASAQSMDREWKSPFVKAAAQAGFVRHGGKPDDITVLVSYVTTSKPYTDCYRGDSGGEEEPNQWETERLLVRSESELSCSSTASSLCSMPSDLSRLQLEFPEPDSSETAIETAPLLGTLTWLTSLAQLAPSPPQSPEPKGHASAPLLDPLPSLVSLTTHTPTAAPSSELSQADTSEATQLDTRIALKSVAPLTLMVASDAALQGDARMCAKSCDSNSCEQRFCACS